MPHSPDFLSPQDRPIKKQIRPVLYLVLAVLAVIILLTPLFVFGSRAYISLRATQTELNKIEQSFSSLDIDSANESLQTAKQKLLESQTSLQILTPYYIVPYLGKQLRATRALVETGIATIEAIEVTFDFAKEIFGVIDASTGAQAILSLGLPPQATLAALTPIERQALLAKITQSVEILERARERLQIAMDHFNSIPRDGLFAPLANGVDKIAQKLPKLVTDFDHLIPLLKIFPALAGYPEESDLLIIFLNNSELRPGGGFIGALGTTKVKDAEVGDLETIDSYAIDGPVEGRWNIVPPAPIVNYLGMSSWYLRDANWSPDFAVSTEQVLKFYKEELELVGKTPKPINTVIAFTPSFASEILRVTGPIEVADQIFTSENLFDALEYKVEVGYKGEGIPTEQRKEILAVLVENVVLKLVTLPIQDWEKVLDAVALGFKQKQLMVWSKETELQNLLDKQNWSGRVVTGTEDFVMAVDANMAALKSDIEVSRSITYRIVPEGDNLLASVAITYRHDGHFDWKTTRLRTYTRLYVPLGSEFVGVTGALKDDKIKNPARELGTIDISSELGATVFGTFTSIEPGEERTLTFTYRLPKDLVEHIKSSDEYDLKFQKQLGAFTHNLTLELNFGKNFKEAMPAEETRELGDMWYRTHTNLAEDKEFLLRF